MKIAFHRKYTCALGGTVIRTFLPGDVYEIDPDGRDRCILDAVLERGDAVEVKPEDEMEIKEESSTPLQPEVRIFPRRRNAR